MLRLSDIADLGAAAAGEELVPAALEDGGAVLALLAGVDAVVHLGVSVEAPFELILWANIVGSYHLCFGQVQPLRRPAEPNWIEVVEKVL